MRADRLIALMMLLQARGRMTARELARELEVSERTIYRDIEALGAAGIPVTTSGGPGGGCGLLEHYRTTLTGLTEDEAQALFMVSIPAPLTMLGVSDELRSAMRKISASMSESRRAAELHAQQRIYLDAAWWFQSEERVPHLQAIYQAVRQDRQIRIHYLRIFEPRGEVQGEHVLEPYGLVAKASVWYLVAAQAGQPRVYRVAQVVAVDVLEAEVVRPVDFDLAAFWRRWCDDVERSRSDYPVTVRVAPALIPMLARRFGEWVRTAAERTPPDAEGWLTLQLSFERLEEARVRLLGFGGAIEVLAPIQLRRSLADFAAQIVRRYQATV